MLNMYSDLLIEEARQPSNFGKLDSFDVSSTQFNASCGDVMGVQIKLSDDKKEIKEIRWKGEGCIVSMATMSVLTQYIQGMTIEEVCGLTLKNLLKILDLKEISLGRVKCLMIGLSVIKKALKG